MKPKRKNQITRVTADLDAVITRKIKIIAAERGRYFFEVIEEALRDYEKKYRASEVLGSQVFIPHDTPAVAHVEKTNAIESEKSEIVSEHITEREIDVI